MKKKIEEWIYEKFNRYPCALPEHLRDYNGTGKVKLHTDWPVWPLTKIPRSANIRGPRCGEGNPGYMAWPPKLKEGFDVTRWEWCDEKGNRKEIYIPAFKGVVTAKTAYTGKWPAIDVQMNPFHYLPEWVDLNDGWWPSCIPTTSEYGYLEMENGFKCKWRTKPSWRKYYWRTGPRHDFDMYYNLSRVYFGRNPE